MLHKNLCCKFITAFISVILITATATAKSQTEEIACIVKKQYEKACDGFIFKQMLVSNFGVGTMYEAYSSDRVGRFIEKEKVLSKRWLIASPESWFQSWFIENTPEPYRIAATKGVISEGATGKFTLTGSPSTEGNLDAVIPIKKILNIEAGLDFKNGVTFIINSNVQLRKLAKVGLKSVVKDKNFDPEIKRYLEDEKILINTQDVVLNGYTAEIEVDKNINPKLVIEMDKAIGSVGSASGNISFRRSNSGKYTVTNKEKVVVAVLCNITGPPKINVASIDKPQGSVIESSGGGGNLNNLDNFDNWGVAEFSESYDK